MNAIHIISSSYVSKQDITLANELLERFVIDFQALYGKIHMVFNVHSLTHLSSCVEKCGPLFCYSNYVMEDNMGKLLTNIHGTSDVLQQCCTRYLLEKNLENLLINSSIAQKYHEDIRAQKYYCSYEIEEGVHVIGKQIRNMENTHIDYIRNVLQLDTPIAEYEAAIVRSIFYESRDYKAQKIRARKLTNDYFVSLQDNSEYGEIKAIFTASKVVYFLIHLKFETENTNNRIKTLRPRQDNEEYMIARATRIGTKHVLIEEGNLSTCVRFPNIYEKN